jgi:GT2 family glycosyltransferase
MKKTAIIMINYKNYASKFLEDSITSLKNQTYPFKLFIVDNSSSENSRTYIKKIAPDAEIIINEGEKINKGNNGYALGNNQGFRSAILQNFDYVVASNMDTVFDKDWLKNLVQTAEENAQAGAVQAKILMYKDKNKINSTGNKIHFLGFGYCEDYGVKNYEIKETKEINYASGCSVLYKTEILKKIGMYDEDFFMYHEDTDLSWRIWQAGYKVILAPNSIVYHKYEFNRSIMQFYFMERNRFLTILTNYKIKTLFLIFPAFLLMELGLFGFSIKNKTYKTKLRVYCYFINPANWIKLHKSRTTKQKHRKIKDQEIVKKFTGKLEFQEVENPILKYIANPFFNLYWTLAKQLIWW